MVVISVNAIIKNSLAGLVVIICCSSAATAASRVTEENYLEYHRGIIKCEEEFLFKNSIRHALDGYKQLFETYRKPFAKDCFIALQLACNINDTANATYFFQKAFERGVCWTEIEKSSVIRRFFESRIDATPSKNAYKTRILSLYPACRAKWERGINKALREQILGMKKIDGATHTLMDTKSNSKDQFEAESRYIEVLDSNTILLVQLIHQYGYIGDNMVGFLEKYGDSSNSRKHKDELTCTLWPLTDQLILHQSCCYFLIASELRTALRNGEILPAMYALIYEWAYMDIRDKLPQFRRGHPANKLCVPYPARQTEFYNIGTVFTTVDDTTLVNCYRSELGLPSEAHEKKKRKYEIREELQLFFGMAHKY